MLSPSLATKGPHVPLGPKGMLCPRRRTKAPMDTSHVPLSPLCHHPHYGPTSTSPACPHPLWHWGTALWGVLSPRPRTKGPIGTTPAWHRPPCAAVPYGTGTRPYKGHFGPTRVTVLWAQDKGTPCATTLPTCVPGMRPSGPFPQRRHRKRSFPFCCPRGCSFSHPKWGHTPPPLPSPYRSFTLLLSRPLCALPPKQRQGLSPIPHNTVNPNGTVSPQ